MESFIPLWEWDVPKKKSKKRKDKEGESSEKTSKKAAEGTNGQAPSADQSSTPLRSRSATIEEVEDDGS